MKQLIVSVICLVAAVAQTTRGQDSSANKSATQRPTPTVKRVQPPAMRQRVAKTPRGSRLNYPDARQPYRHERHDWVWWKRHFTTIVFISSGYYYLDSGYWWPAWGYDPRYELYGYDGPIYTYGNLLPDQVIINVQRALRQLGYYSGGLTGSLGPALRAALAAYEEDAGLDVTGAIDGATVQSLGLY